MQYSSRWTQTSAEHIPLIKEAFAQQRRERPKHYVSYLAEPGIADFHCDRLIKQIEQKPEDAGFKALLHGDKLLALAGIEKSDWHSRHFRIPYYKIQPFFCFSDELGEIEQITDKLNELLIHEGSVYTTRAEANQHALSYQLGRSGFVQVGTSVRMVFDQLERKMIDSHQSQNYDSFKIRPYLQQDLPKLKDIIRRSHRYSHFFCEMRFDPEDARNLFAEWMERCAKSPAFHILIAERYGEPIGFCSAPIQQSLVPYIGRTIGIIDFIAVDSSIQGKGIGRALLLAAFNWFEPQTNLIELRTMADNLRAIRFYENNGFRMLSADHHFHRWT